MAQQTPLYRRTVHPSTCRKCHVCGRPLVARLESWRESDNKNVQVAVTNPTNQCVYQKSVSLVKNEFFSKFRRHYKSQFEKYQTCQKPIVNTILSIIIIALFYFFLYINAVYTCMYICLFVISITNQFISLLNVMTFVINTPCDQNSNQTLNKTLLALAKYF